MHQSKREFLICFPNGAGLKVVAGSLPSVQAAGREAAKEHGGRGCLPCGTQILEVKARASTSLLSRALASHLQSHPPADCKTGHSETETR